MVESQKRPAPGGGKANRRLSMIWGAAWRPVAGAVLGTMMLAAWGSAEAASAFGGLGGSWSGTGYIQLENGQREEAHGRPPVRSAGRRASAGRSAAAPTTFRGAAAMPSASPCAAPAPRAG